MNDDQVLAQDQEEVITPAEEAQSDAPETVEIASEGEDITQESQVAGEVAPEELPSEDNTVAEDTTSDPFAVDEAHPDAKWYVVHTYSGHENKVATQLKLRVESEHLEEKILDVLVPTQDKIEIKGGKRATIKEKIFPGYILVKMVLDDNSWITVRTTQGVTGFIGMGNKPTPISAAEVRSIVKFMSQGESPTFKTNYSDGDTVKIVDTANPFHDFIGKIENVDSDRGKVRVLVSIFGRETPVELDFTQVQKL